MGRSSAATAAPGSGEREHVADGQRAHDAVCGQLHFESRTAVVRG